MKRLRTYCKEFFTQEDGVEFLEIAIGVACVVIVITVLVQMYNSIKDKVQDATNKVKDIDVEKGTAGGTTEP